MEEALPLVDTGVSDELCFVFRVPGDIDEVNTLKLQVDQWRIPENLSDANVPGQQGCLWGYIFCCRVSFLSPVSQKRSL